MSASTRKRPCSWYASAVDEGRTTCRRPDPTTTNGSASPKSSAVLNRLSALKRPALIPADWSNEATAVGHDRRGRRNCGQGHGDERRGSGHPRATDCLRIRCSSWRIRSPLTPAWRPTSARRNGGRPRRPMRSSTDSRRPLSSFPCPRSCMWSVRASSSRAVLNRCTAGASDPPVQGCGWLGVTQEQSCRPHSRGRRHQSTAKSKSS